MPGRDDSSWRAGGAGRWLAAQQVVWAVVAVGALALAAPGQQASDPAVARVLRELQAWEGDPVTIARALVKMGDAAEASRMAGSIGKTERNWKLLILTVIAEAHAAIGDPANRKAWEDALRAAETGTQRVRVLLKIAEAQVYAGDREAALRTLEQALVAERSMNRKELEGGPLLDRDFLEARIAVLRADAGDITGAIRLANTISHIQVQCHALAQIAAAQAALGDIKGALETAGTIRPPDPTQGYITDLSDRCPPCPRSSRRRPGRAMWPAPWPRPTGWVRRARRGLMR